MMGHNSTSDTLYLREKINELIDKLQEADSKAKTYYSECTVLKERLKISEEMKKRVEQELNDTQETVRELKEELNTTSVNYQHQLSTMSEHLATMNEKLTSQKDEIESLKLQLKNKAKSKK